MMKIVVAIDSLKGSLTSIQAGEAIEKGIKKVDLEAEVVIKPLADGGINILHEVASDGASELLAARINEMSDEDYTQYLRYHFYICEKPELLGMTNHLLFMGEKK